MTLRAAIKLLTVVWACGLLLGCRSRAPNSGTARAKVDSHVTVKWRFPHDSAIVSIAGSQDGQLFLGVTGLGQGTERSPGILALDAAGRAKWQLHGNPSSSGTIWVTASPWGNVYGLDAGGGIYAYLGARSFYRVEPGTTFNGPPVCLRSGDIFAGSNRGLLRLSFEAVGSATSVAFSDTGRSHAYTPGVGPDDTLYFCTSYGGRMYAVDPLGTLKWSLRLGDRAPLVGPDGTVYGKTERRLAVVLNDGTLRWERESATGFASLALGRDGTLYAVDRGGRLVAFSTDGNETWALNLTPSPRVPARLALTAGGRLFASDAGDLVALDLAGRVRWRWRPEATKPLTAAFAGPDETLLIRFSDNELWAVVAS